MGLLDGDIARAMGGVFGGIYLDADLFRSILAKDGRGGGSQTFAGAEAVKVQFDEVRELLYEGNPERFQIILMLKHVNGVDVPRPSTDDHIARGSDRYSISMVMGDPAESYWELACKETQAPASP